MRSTPPTACGSSSRDRGWVLVLPDPADAVTHLWAEGNDADTAQLLLDEWAVGGRTGRTLGTRARSAGGLPPSVPDTAVRSPDIRSVAR